MKICEPHQMRVSGGAMCVLRRPSWLRPRNDTAPPQYWKKSNHLRRVLRVAEFSGHASPRENNGPQCNEPMAHTSSTFSDHHPFGMDLIVETKFVVFVI